MYVGIRTCLLIDMKKITFYEFLSVFTVLIVNEIFRFYKFYVKILMSISYCNIIPILDMVMNVSIMIWRLRYCSFIFQPELTWFIFTLNLTWMRNPLTADQILASLLNWSFYSFPHINTIIVDHYSFLFLQFLIMYNYTDGPTAFLLFSNLKKSMAIA